MNISNSKRIFIFLYVILILVVTISIYGSWIFNKKDNFISLGILDETNKLSSYFDNNLVEFDKYVKWNIHTYNYMSGFSYISIRVKIYNESYFSPDSVEFNIPYLYEIRHILNKNDTWIYSFNWKITEAHIINDRIHIKKIIFNDKEILTDIVTTNDKKLRIIFELWTYDPQNEKFIFKNNNIDQYKNNVWAQIWFKLNII